MNEVEGKTTKETETHEEKDGYTGDKKLGGPNRPAE
ncbi:hypothetical protein SAMN05421737_103130 [Shouchella lonarensis]|uniref:Uncharacterized protein n=1 Tax=Shouchella lonarensis TaxID=1464122 RepID=A0A1G6HAP7_9BACI|nr:hypothetical protein SAMN05421737_103130 [Shouchella lonarensis]